MTKIANRQRLITNTQKVHQPGNTPTLIFIQHLSIISTPLAIHSLLKSYITRTYKSTPISAEAKKIQRSYWIFSAFFGSFFGGAKKNKTLTKIANRQWLLTNTQKVHQPGNTLNRNPNPYLYPTFEHYLHTPCYPQPPNVIYTPNLTKQRQSVQELKKTGGAIGFLTRLPVS